MQNYSASIVRNKIWNRLKKKIIEIDLQKPKIWWFYYFSNFTVFRTYVTFFFFFKNVILVMKTTDFLEMPI